MIREKKVKGGIALSITCDDCGEPLTKTSRNFGMDCKNDCARKKFDPKALDSFLGALDAAGVDLRRKR